MEMWLGEEEMVWEASWSPWRESPTNMSYFQANLPIRDDDVVFGWIFEIEITLNLWGVCFSNKYVVPLVPFVLKTHRHTQPKKIHAFSCIYFLSVSLPFIIHFCQDMANINLQYPKGQHPLHLAACWILRPNALNTRPIQASWPVSSRAKKKKPFKIQSGCCENFPTHAFTFFLQVGGVVKVLKHSLVIFKG